MRPWGGKSKAEGPTGGTGESLRGAGVARLAIGGRRATWLREARNRPRKRYGPIFSQPHSHMVTSRFAVVYDRLRSPQAGHTRILGFVVPALAGMPPEGETTNPQIGLRAHTRAAAIWCISPDSSCG